MGCDSPAVSEPLNITHPPCSRHILKSCSFTLRFACYGLSDKNFLSYRISFKLETFTSVFCRPLSTVCPWAIQPYYKLDTQVSLFILDIKQQKTHTGILCPLLVNETTCTKQNKSGIYIRCYHFSLNSCKPDKNL